MTNDADDPTPTDVIENESETELMKEETTVKHLGVKRKQNSGAKDLHYSSEPSLAKTWSSQPLLGFSCVFIRAVTVPPMVGWLVIYQIKMTL